MTYNQKDKEAVLARLLSLRDERNLIYRPPRLFSSIPGISPSDFSDYLKSWENDGYINVQYADFQESDNIYVISLEPDAISYFSDKQSAEALEAKRRRIENIRWAITTLIALAALVKSFFFT